MLELNQRAHIGGHSFPILGDFNNRAAEALIDHYFPHSRQLIQHPLAHFSFDAIKQALASPWVNQVTLQTLRPDHQHWRGSISTPSHLDELKRQLNRERLRYRLFSLGKDSLWIDALITPKQHAFLQKLDVNQGKNLYQIKGDEPDTQLESILDQDPASLLTPLPFESPTSDDSVASSVVPRAHQPGIQAKSTTKPRHPSKLKQPDLSQGFSYSNSGDTVLKIGE